MTSKTMAMSHPWPRSRQFSFTAHSTITQIDDARPTSAMFAGNTTSPQKSRKRLKLRVFSSALRPQVGLAGSLSKVRNRCSDIGAYWRPARFACSKPCTLLLARERLCDRRDALKLRTTGVECRLFLAKGASRHTARDFQAIRRIKQRSGDQNKLSLSVWRRFGHTRGRRGWRPPPICWAGGWLRAVGSSLMWVMTSDLVDRLGPRRILTQRSRRAVLVDWDRADVARWNLTPGDVACDRSTGVIRAG